MNETNYIDTLPLNQPHFTENIPNFKNILYNYLIINGYNGIVDGIFDIESDLFSVGNPKWNPRDKSNTNYEGMVIIENEEMITLSLIGIETKMHLRFEDIVSFRISTTILPTKTTKYIFLKTLKYGSIRLEITEQIEN